MATIKFVRIGETIHARMSVGRGTLIKKSTGYKCTDVNDWDASKGMIKIGGSHERRKLRAKVKHLKDTLDERLSHEVNPDAMWLSDNINDITNKKQRGDITLFANYFELFLERAPERAGHKRDGGTITQRRIGHYNNVKQKVSAFDKHRKRETYLTEIDKRWGASFIDFLRNRQQLGDGTIQGIVKTIKTICNEAVADKVITHIDFKQIAIAKAKTQATYLSFDELDIIEALEIEQSYLDNARDWLLIACEIGQRGGDLLRLEHVAKNDDMMFVDIKQQKGSELVRIALSPRARRVIDKHGGRFPRRIAESNYNEYIKRVCERAGIDEPTHGKLMQVVGTEQKRNKRTGEIETRDMYRKVEGTYPKWKLISTHVGRRSFASNYYGLMPVEYIMSVTGHTTEKQLLAYIKKPKMTFASYTYQAMMQIEHEHRRNKQPKMKVV